MYRDSPDSSRRSFVLPPLRGWRRVLRFLGRPLSHQYYSVALRLQARFPTLQFPIRLSFGASYLVGHSEVDHRILFGDFEVPETRFLQRLLAPGMTVLDIGAQHGFYSLLLSAVVGDQGSVDAFEPSPREFDQLRRNLVRNRRKNVRLHNCALGSSCGTATLYEASRRFDAFNSLREQQETGRARAVLVNVVTLDRFLKEANLGSVDLIKMDVEGGELAILEGASDLLAGRPRPVVLAEVSDLRTKAWGYGARRIIDYLCARDYDWHEIDHEGFLHKVEHWGEFVDGNFVAWPRETPHKVNGSPTCGGGRG